jgi:hypothetical protein
MFDQTFACLTRHWDFRADIANVAAEKANSAGHYSNVPRKLWIPIDIEQSSNKIPAVCRAVVECSTEFPDSVPHWFNASRIPRFPCELSIIGSNPAKEGQTFGFAAWTTTNAQPKSPGLC